MKVQTEKYVELDYSELNLDEYQLEGLAKLGLNMIKENQKHLVDYAINRLLSDVIYDSEPDVTTKKKLDILKQKIKLEIEK